MLAQKATVIYAKTAAAAYSGDAARIPFRCVSSVRAPLPTAVEVAVERSGGGKTKRGVKQLRCRRVEKKGDVGDERWLLSNCHLL